jgi:hypothetical protein
MKKVFMACAVLWALSVVAAAQSASFAGTWELDKSKSKIDERMASRLNSQTLTVTQDDKEVKVERKTDMAAPAGGGPGGGAPGGPPPGGGQGGPGGGRGMGGGMMGAPNSTYKLDGSEVVTENPRGGKMASKAKLSGGMLEIKSANTIGN